MNRTFNNGIGMVLVVAPEDASATAQTLTQLGQAVYTIGQIDARGSGEAAAVVVH
jgi:phosphoribosylformylglycinamidine cyclo-ligase